jgi:amino acid transporter
LPDGKKSFARETTGLVREIGPLTAVIIILAVTGWAFFPFDRGFSATGNIPLPENLWFAGIPPNVMALIIVGIFALLMVVGYSILGSAMPRSGGGYVAISRIINPFVGFIAGWLVFLTISFYLGGIAVSLVQHFYFPASPILNDVNPTVGGLLLLVVFAVISAFGVRVSGYLIQALFWVSAVITVYVLCLFAITILHPAVLEQGISLWAQTQGASGVTAETYVKAALAQGLDSANVGNYWTAVSASFIWAVWSYFGFFLVWGAVASTSFVLGEVKDPKRNLPKVMIIGALVAIIVLVGVAWISAYAAASVGQTTLPNGDRWSFLGAYSFLTFTASLTQAHLPPIRMFVHILAMMVAQGLGLGSFNVILFLFPLLLAANEIPALMLAGSRLIFAMSFDRVFPETFAKVNRFHVPLGAVVLVAILGAVAGLGCDGVCVAALGGSWNPGGLIGSIMDAFFSWGVTVVDLLTVIFLSLFSFAVLLFPFRRRRFYDSAYFKPGGKLGVTAIGLAGLVANLVIGWEVLTSAFDYNMLAPGYYNWLTLGFNLLFILIGAAIYAYYKWGPPKKQVDYARIFSEIPPE